MDGTNHGIIVNLYQMAKMLDEEYEAYQIPIKDAIYDVRIAMLDSYNMVGELFSSLTFEEYVNRQRQLMAGMLGRYEYA